MVCQGCHQSVAHTTAHKPDAIRNILRYNDVEDILAGLAACEDEGKIVDEEKRLVNQVVEERKK
jgi:hypothetical protein